MASSLRVAMATRLIKFFVFFPLYKRSNSFLSLKEALGGGAVLAVFSLLLVLDPLLGLLLLLLAAPLFFCCCFFFWGSSSTVAVVMVVGVRERGRLGKLEAHHEVAVSRENCRSSGLKPFERGIIFSSALEAEYSVKIPRIKVVVLLLLYLLFSSSHHHHHHHQRRRHRHHHHHTKSVLLVRHDNDDDPLLDAGVEKDAGFWFVSTLLDRERAAAHVDVALQIFFGGEGVVGGYALRGLLAVYAVLRSLERRRTETALPGRTTLQELPLGIKVQDIIDLKDAFFFFGGGGGKQCVC
jgi:hypothetical protein